MFSMEKLSCDNNEETILKRFKANNAVYRYNCISNNQHKLKRSLEKRKIDYDKQKVAKANKGSKRSDIEEAPPIILADYRYLFCGVSNDVSKLCAGGTQHETLKKINEEKNRAFSDNLWRQASKLQDSHVLSSLSLLDPLRPEKLTTIVCVLMNFTKNIEHWLLQKPKKNRLIHAKQNFIFVR